MTTWYNSITTGIEAYIYFLPVIIAIMFIYSFLTDKFNIVKFVADNALVLYLFCLFTVVFFPLPSAEAASKLNGYHGQWILGRFLFDIAKDRSLESVLQVLFNIVMLVPFGAYLRLCRKADTRKVVALSFCLSLFIEIGQFTGLFFTYGGSYRLFDVDDLLFNTLGGAAGAVLTSYMLAYVASNRILDAQKSLTGLADSIVYTLSKSEKHA